MRAARGARPRSRAAPERRARAHAGGRWTRPPGGRPPALPAAILDTAQKVWRRPTVTATCVSVDDGDSVLIIACDSTEPAGAPCTF